MKFTGIIPARYASTRFPGKPLAMLGGKPVIQHVWERASAALPQLIVATDDERIARTVAGFGGRAAMTAPTHRCGTERCAEAAADCDADVIINIQGDEPFVSAEQLRALMACFDDPDTDIATLKRPLADDDPAADNPNTVKVVTDLRGFALYFSRSPIPYIRDPKNATARYAHVGLYAYRKRVLEQIVRLQPSPLELAESLEQLRWLENGYRIKVAECSVPGVGIDTPEDLEAAERLLVESARTDAAEEPLDRSLQPEIHPIAPRDLVEPERRTLPNGIHLAAFDKPGHELVKVTVVMPGGKAELGPVRSAAVVRLLKDGCEGMTGEEVAETLDYNGAEITASATDHNCMVSLVALRRTFDRVLPLFVRLLTSADYPETAVNAYRRNQIAHLQGDLQTPSYNAAKAARAQFWGPDHPLGRELSIEAFDQLDSADLRNCLHSIVVPSQMHVIVAGEADSEAVDAVAEAFGSVTGASEGLRDVRPMPPTPPVSPEPTVVEVPGSLQYALTAWMPAVGIDHPDYWPLCMAVHMLGGYFGSRLMLNIREDKGYTYGIGAGLAPRPEGALTVISCEFDKQYLDGVLTELRRELRRMATEPAGEEEFQRLKLNMAGNLATSVETPEGQLSQMAMGIAAGYPADRYARQWQALEEVTPQQMAEVSARYLDPALMHTVLAG